jgi:centromeric protein E
MEGQIASFEEALINTISEKEEALTRLEVVTSELEELSKMMSLAESEIEALKNKVETKVYLHELHVSKTVVQI